MHFVHPGILLLLRFQAEARLRRLARRVTSPRRLVLTGVAVLLALFWLGNAAVSILFREPFDPHALGRLLPLALLAYACWHVLKLVYERPEEGIEWTPAEQEWLCAKPLERRELVVFRFAAIGLSAAFKAAVFALLMLPDLHLPWAGFLGMLLGLVFLDFLRMSLEITAWGVSDRVYRHLRLGVGAVAVLAAGWALAAAMSSPLAAEALRSPASLKMMTLARDALVGLSETPGGQVLEAPFAVFGQVVLADRADAGLLAGLALAAALVGGMAYTTLRLDGWFVEQVNERERAAYGQIKREAAAGEEETHFQFQPSPRGCGIGAVLWRQWQGFRRNTSGIAFALALPAVLSCLPWLAEMDPRWTLWNVVGSLAFYSFLLVPTAVKFDFQRDLDRMALLKSLPIRPTAMVLGQLATPVLVVTVLQFFVLSTTALVHGLDLGLVLVAQLLLTALDTIIFGLDNLLFLWFPYRLRQEGLVIFLRTTLVFTAKGVLFAMALGLVLVWAAVAPWLAEHCGIPRQPTFFAGLWAMMLSLGAVLIWLMVKAYSRFDPSLDCPS